MASVANKTKLESENRNFDKDWTLKYLFILSTEPNSKPMCLLCNECLLVLKEYNVKHRFTTKHGYFGRSYPILPWFTACIIYISKKEEAFNNSETVKE